LLVEVEPVFSPSFQHVVYKSANIIIIIIIIFISRLPERQKPIEMAQNNRKKSVKKLKIQKVKQINK